MTNSPGPPVSPRLSRLSRELDQGDRTALDTFWRGIVSEGTPLIESPADERDSALVTFLFRDGAVHEHVLLVCALAEHGNDDMTRLPGTDTWYRTYRARTDLRTVYTFVPDHRRIDWLKMSLHAAQAALSAQAAEARRDELNPRVFDYRIPALPGVPPMPPASVLELPHAPPQPWAGARDDVPRGRVKSHRFDSEAMGGSYAVWVYTPPGYSAEAPPYASMIVFDGFSYTRTIDTPAMLDNLLSESRIRPLVAAFVQGTDRLSELLCNPSYAGFIADELVPWLRDNFNITAAPEQTIVAGSSAGGLAASFLALRRPDVFGNVLSQSGSYWWSPDGDPEHEWLTRQYADADRHPLRFYVDVGLLEGPTLGGGPTQVDANRRFRDVLHDRGYDVTYREFSGGHDAICWRGTLADGLIALAGVGG